MDTLDSKQEKDYINILSLFVRYSQYLKKYWPIILLISFILMGIFGFLSLKPSSVTYSSDVAFSYGIKIKSSTEFSYTLTGIRQTVEVDALASSLTEMINTSLFKDALKEKLDTDSINTTLSFSYTGNTNLGTLTAESPDEEEVIPVLLAALEILPDVARPVTGPIEIHLQGDPKEISKTEVDLPTAFLAVAGFAAGLVLGLLILVALTLIRHELSSEADITDYLSLKVFGSIPFLHAKGTVVIIDRIKQRWLRLKSTDKKDSELVKTSSYQEQLRLISGQISQILKENHYQSLLIMSTKPAEGKTFVTEALSNELTEGGWNVTVLHDLNNSEISERNQADNNVTLFDFSGTTSDLHIMKAADIADASLLIIKHDTDLARDIKWGLHYLKNCRAVCIGAILNSVI